MLITCYILNKDYQILRGLWVRGIMFAPQPWVEDADPPSHPATNQKHPAVPVIGKFRFWIRGERLLLRGEIDGECHLLVQVYLKEFPAGVVDLKITLVSAASVSIKLFNIQTRCYFSPCIRFLWSYIIPINLAMPLHRFVMKNLGWSFNATIDFDPILFAFRWRLLL